MLLSGSHFSEWNTNRCKMYSTSENDSTPSTAASNAHPTLNAAQL